MTVAIDERILKLVSLLLSHLPEFKKIHKLFLSAVDFLYLI